MLRKFPSGVSAGTLHVPSARGIDGTPPRVVPVPRSAGNLGVTSAVFRLSLVIVLSLFVCAACGKKSSPRAPELAIPERIDDLRASTGKRGVLLRWTRPQNYVDGTSLTDLAGFVLFRKEVPADCPDCRAPYRERVVIDVEDQDRFIKQTDYEFRDPELVPETIYRYRIFSRLLDGSLSEPSNEVIVEWNP